MSQKFYNSVTKKYFSILLILKHFFASDMILKTPVYRVYQRSKTVFKTGIDQAGG
jgi:hypothetical protein